MKELEDELKEELRSNVYQSFSGETMNYIRERERKVRIAISLFLLIICTVGFAFIPFEQLTFDNIPFLDVTININKIYVVSAISLTLIFFFDVLLRSLIAPKTLLDKY
jgi:uncharacterized membrane protein